MDRASLWIPYDLLPIADVDCAARFVTPRKFNVVSRFGSGTSVLLVESRFCYASQTHSSEANTRTTRSSDDSHGRGFHFRVAIRREISRRALYRGDLCHQRDMAIWYLVDIDSMLAPAIVQQQLGFTLPLICVVGVVCIPISW